jgi:acetyl esterase/lipase
MAGATVDPEIRRALALLPRLDYGDPVAVRATMGRFMKLSALAGLRPPAASGVEVVDRVAPTGPSAGVRVRVYVPDYRAEPAPAIVYFHGGAFVIGDLDFEHPRCLEMAAATSSVVIAVDYRLAPEHPFPASVEDCYAAFVWATRVASELAIDASRIAVAGASAGGALAAAVTLMARDRGAPAPVFQLLLYPVTDDRMITPSMAAFVDTPGWNRRNSEHMWAHYLGDRRTRAEPSPYAAPARAHDLGGLPPAYVMTAEIDALRDEGLRYAHRLVEAGVPTELHHYPSTFHGFDVLADAEISRRARAEHHAVLCNALGEAALDRQPAVAGRVSRQR